MAKTEFPLSIDRRRLLVSAAAAAVLHQGPVTSPVEAVRAAIVAEYRSESRE